MKNIYSHKGQSQEEVDLAINELKKFIKHNHLQVFKVLIYENEIPWYRGNPHWTWRVNPWFLCLKNKSQAYSLIAKSTCEGGVTIAVDPLVLTRRLSGWGCREVQYKLVPSHVDYSDLRVSRDITGAAMSFLGLED